MDSPAIKVSCGPAVDAPENHPQTPEAARPRRLRPRTDQQEHPHVDYAGELVRNDASEAREACYLVDGCIWVFRGNRTWSPDAAAGGNIARFINHLVRTELLD